MKTITRAWTVPISIHFWSRIPWGIKQTYNPPVLLFYQGDGKLLQTEDCCWARETTREGVHSVEKILRSLEMNWSLLVDLLRELDATGSLRQYTKWCANFIGRIGTGLDVFIQREIKGLQAHMGRTPIWSWSEYGPGQAPLKFHFPERNRIIAGLVRLWLWQRLDLFR